MDVEPRDKRPNAAQPVLTTANTPDRIDGGPAQTCIATMAGERRLIALGKRRANRNDAGGTAGPRVPKRRKSAAAVNVSKAIAPLDMEKRCGVELPQGGRRARGLTCKVHNMSAKRAVPGRCAPYDSLLTGDQ